MRPARGATSAIVLLLILAALVPRPRPAFGGEGEVPPGRCTIRGSVARGGDPAAARIEVRRLGGPEAAAPHGALGAGDRGWRPSAAASDRGTRTTRAGADGRFDVPGLRAGVYAVLATGAEGDVALALVLAAARGARAQAALTLAPPRVLGGRALWSDGRPVTGRVHLTARRRGQGRTRSGPYEPWSDARPWLPDGPTWSAPLAADGTFELGGLTPAPHAVRIVTSAGVVLSGYEPWQPTGAPIDWTVAVAATERTGRVLDAATGAPIPGARIAARFRPPGGPTQSVFVRGDGEGRFALRTTDGTVTLTVHADGHAPRVLPADAGQRETVVQLDALHHLTGRAHDRQGKPAAGARVVVAPATRQPAWIRYAHSEDDGRFVVKDVPPGEAVVFVRGGGWASIDLDQVAARGPNPFVVTVGETAIEPLELVVQATTGLRGRVLDEAGRPVRGATIRALGRPRARSRQGFENPAARVARVGSVAVATDGAGAFSVPDLVPGLLYELEVTAPGRPRLRRGPFAASAPPAEGVAIRFPQSRWVDVRVLLEETGAPVAGARVHLLSESHVREWLPPDDDVTTDPRGRARVGPLGDGPLSVHVWAAGTLARSEPWPVPESEQGNGLLAVTVRLPSGLQITGRVTGPQGEPPPGAVVRARGKGERAVGAVAEAEADGTFVLRGLRPGPYDLRVQVPDVGAATLGGRAAVRAGQTGVVLRLTAGQAPPVQRLRVRVLGPDGAPVPRVDVSLVGRRRSIGTSCRDGVADFTLDWSGDDAVKQELEQGALYVVVERARDATGTPLPLGAAVAGPVTLDQHEVTVRLKAEKAIAGRVLTAQGEPLAGVAVTAQGPLAGPEDGRHYRSRAITRTDAQGRFHLHGLRAGAHTIEVRATDAFIAAEPVPVDAGTQDLEIRLAMGVAVSVRVLDAESRPLGGVRMRLHEARARRRGEPRRRSRGDWRATTTADGGALLTRLDPELTYDVEIWPPPGREDLREVRLDSWSPAPLEIRLPRGVTVSGSVRDVEGRLVVGAGVRIRTGRSMRYLTARDGTFRVIRLAPGRIVVRARAPGPHARDWDDPDLAEVVLPKDGGDVALVLREP